MSKSGLHLVAYILLVFFISSNIASRIVGVPSCSKETSPVFTLQHNSTNGILARSLPQPALIDCSEHCASSSDCIGIEYWQGICRVISEDKKSTYTPTDDTSVFLTKSCVKSDRICSSPFHFDVYEQKILVGFAREVVPAESIEICMAACLNAFDTYGFECESAMFYPVDSECILNTEDRLDRPDLFVVEKEDVVYYLDSNCAGSQCYAPYITQYIAVEGKQIENELDRKFENTDFQTCEELCTGRITVTQNDFTCKSFMYNPETKVCYLSDERSKPLGRAKLGDANGFTYYEKKCFASPRTCRQTPSFNRVPQMILVGFAAFVMENVPSVTMCLDQCTNPPPETGEKFICKSVMYYYNEQECILNAETRYTKPDLFIPEGDEFLVDYFDITCHLEPEKCPEGTYLRGIKSINSALPEGEGALHVIESVGKSLEECMDKCNELYPEKCRSFNFEKSSGLCNLLYLDGKSTLKPFIKNGFDLVDLQCLSTKDDCSTKKDGITYAKYLYSQQPGIPTKTEKVIGTSKCLDLCTESERCEGVNYNRRTGECQLFQVIDGPAKLKKSEHIDFYQNLCSTKENEGGVSSALNVPQPTIIATSASQNGSKIDVLTKKNPNKDGNQVNIYEPEKKYHPKGAKNETETASVDEKPVLEGSETVTSTPIETGSLEKNIITAPPSIPKIPDGPLPTPILIPADQVQTICDYEGIKVQIKSPQSFTGVIFVKNHYETCRVEVSASDSATLELGLPASFGMKPITLTPSSTGPAGAPQNGTETHKVVVRSRRDTQEKSCGITEIENGKYKSTVVIQTNNLGIPGLVTSTDQIYEIGCDYSSMLGGKITTAANMTVNGPTPTDIKPRGKIELGNPVLMQMNAGTGDHQPVLQAKLGDILELRWEIMAMDEELDFFVKDCHAEPGTGAGGDEKLQLIEGGCPTPAVAQKLIPQPIKLQSSAVKIAHLQAFRFDSSSSVRITCNIEICKGDCKPATCDIHGESKESWGRKKRSTLEEDVKEFETNRYRVPRFSQATTSLLILDPLQNTFETSSAMAKVSSLDLLAEDPATTLFKIKETAHMNGNLCMGKVTLFSVFGVLLTLIVIQAVVVTNYIFKRVMSSRKISN
uniref:No mechanoreceptor potential A (inferred by orthology to a D. melanogaster protein) n=1 Tax=Strongyloides venezuelensis TaxID=75913 RepID=A0A0K0EZ99_STRVS